MSKKKAATTMTLKDFHGGSIPSELPLPSAPGVSARPPDRAAAARHDHLRPRHGSAASAVAAVDRPPAFLSQPVRIARHFDEDERTPFDAPRRPQQTPTPLPPAGLRSDSRPQIAVAAASAVPNAWAARKEAAVGPTPAPAPAPTVWSVSKIAEASAVGKVISGRWHSKPPPDPEVVRVHETEGSDSRSVDGATEIERGRPRSVGFSARNRGLGRARSPVNPQLNEGALDMFYDRGDRPATHEGRFTAPQSGLEGLGEVPEPQKLSLLPRTRPLEFTETRAPDDKQGYQLTVSSRPSESAYENRGHVTASKADRAAADGGNRAAERPRLNLKPRSQPAGQPNEIVGKERRTVFGGARPRELVLKERELDIVSSDLDKTSPASRHKSDVAKTEAKLETTTNNLPGGKAENFASGQRGLGNTQRNYNRHDTNRVDGQRASGRNDNRKITRDLEKLPEQPCLEPETWHKPTEQLKHDVSVPGPGKAATALELAQAFSRSGSDSRPPSQFTNQGGVPTQNEVIFSRLIDNGGIHGGAAQRKINGY